MNISVTKELDRSMGLVAAHLNLLTGVRALCFEFLCELNLML